MQASNSASALRLLPHSRQVLVWAIAGMISFLYGCGWAGSTDKAPEPPIVRQFRQQVSASCAAPVGVYSLEIIDLAAAGSVAEIQRFPDWQIEEGDTMVCRLPADLMYAFGQFYQDPYISAYFGEEKRGDTLVARLHPGKGASIELKQQKLVFASSGAQLLYVESLIVKEHWLFDLRAHIRVHFEPDGSYHSHTMELYEHTAWLKNPFHVLIQGRRDL